MAHANWNKHNKLYYTISHDHKQQYNSNLNKQVYLFLILQHFLPKFSPKLSCVFAKVLIDETCGVF